MREMSLWGRSGISLGMSAYLVGGVPISLYPPKGLSERVEDDARTGRNRRSEDP